MSMATPPQNPAPKQALTSRNKIVGGGPHPAAHRTFTEGTQMKNWKLTKQKALILFGVIAVAAPVILLGISLRPHDHPHDHEPAVILPADKDVPTVAYQLLASCGDDPRCLADSVHAYCFGVNQNDKLATSRCGWPIFSFIFEILTGPATLPINI